MNQQFLRLLYEVGFLRMWGYFRRNKITIMTLHGVMDREIASQWEPLRPRTSRQLFDDTLRLALDYFNFVTIDEAVDMLKGEIPIKRNSCVITFDDGQLNNLQVALPILRKYNIPVVFYPTTGRLDQNASYWFDRLDYAIQQPGLDGLKIDVGQVEIKIDQSSRKHMAQSLAKLIKSLKAKDQADSSFQNEVDEICSRLENLSGKSINDIGEGDLWSSLMSRQDIVDCATMDSVTIGSHTINHVRLPFADEAERMTELNESKQVLNELTGRPCEHFCYPNGDWDENSVLAVKNAGYKTAVTTDPGSNAVGDDLYTLKRYSFPVKGTPLKALFSMTGFVSFVSNVRSISVV
jgi:peptidoglycan/xylan/chitin deacetylase (PgdA/CDA1 family)